VEDIFLVVSKSVAKARNGQPYLKVRLADKTGEVDAFKWDVADADVARFAENDYIFVRASVRTYNDKLQLLLDSVQRWGEAVDPADFIRASRRDPEEMMSELRSLLAQVTCPQLSRLLSVFFDDEDFTAKFREAPAARRVHHACVAGLLEHTLNVTRNCAALADLYPENIRDRDLLITGAVLHDVGKVEEYTWSGAIKFSAAGHLVGHIVGGAMMVKEAAQQIDGFDPILSLALQHIMLAHHGTKEWGSPKRPKSIEALVLHYADHLDAEISIFTQAIEESEERGEEDLFTGKNYLLERPVFKGSRNRSEQTNEVDPEKEADLDLLTVDSDHDPFADE
jgi:3'-5' exoribonuclease